MAPWLPLVAAFFQLLLGKLMPIHIMPKQQQQSSLAKLIAPNPNTAAFRNNLSLALRPKTFSYADDDNYPFHSYYHAHALMFS